MGKVRFLIVGADGLAPYVAGLRALEHEITYPIADGGDYFRIDHGPEYAPFFTNLGTAHFAVALDGDEVVGSAVGILRRGIAGDRELVTGYGCDYKLASRYRGSGLGRRMLFFGLRELFRPSNSHFRAWRFAYGAAMRGAKGDVLRSGRGFHPLKLMAPYARLAVYFVAPEVLARVEVSGAPPPPVEPGLDLSPDAGAGIVSTAGRKELRLVSTGEPWPLQHLVAGPRAWGSSFGAYLRASGETLVARGLTGPACFALDEQLGGQIAWLSAQGIEPGAVCRIVAWRLFPSLRRYPWVHLATSEI